MTNEQLAELRDPERRMHPRWWMYHFVGPASSGCKIPGDAEMAASDDWQPTGEPSSHIPDWHASDDACFRDWRPVLLAAGCDIWHHEKRTCVCRGPKDIAVTKWEIVACSTFSPDGEGHYRAAILAAVAWLAEHKPELLREAIARMEGGK